MMPCHEQSRWLRSMIMVIVFGPCGALELSGVVRLRSRFVDDFVRGVLRVGAFRLEGWIEGSMGGPTLNWGTFDDAAHDRAAERRRREARGAGGDAEAAFVENLARQGQRRRNAGLDVDGEGSTEDEDEDDAAERPSSPASSGGESLDEEDVAFANWLAGTRSPAVHRP